MVSCSWLASTLPALHAAATAASKSAAATTSVGASWRDSLIMGGLLAWLVFAIIALVKWGVFSARPLLLAPRRTAVGLLPLAFGTLLLYLAFVSIAIALGVSLHLFSPEAFGVDKTASSVPTTLASTQPATAASSAAAAPAESAAQADQRLSVEKMRLQCAGIGAELLACALALMLVHLLTVGGVRAFGLAPASLPWGIVLGILGYLVLFPTLLLDNILVSWLYSHIGHHVIPHETIRDMEATGDFDIRLIFALVAGIGAPVAEEFFFRGLLQTALIQRGWGFLIKFPPDPTYVPPVFQRWAAILICSALFSSIHGADTIPIIFLLSVGLGYLYERTGSLWASIVLHAAFNWSTLLPLLFPGGSMPG